MLRELDLLPVYDSEQHDLIQDLIVPLLRNSTSYLRGVGFFSSGWLRLAAPGLVPLVENGGLARIVTSPVLGKGDWEALQHGEAARQDACLQDILRKNIEELAQSLEHDTLSCLAWLVADAILEFRFAILRGPYAGGDYHDKVGVFMDSAQDVVAIHGSFNDSVQGTLNGEAFSVFKSWDAGQRAFVDMHKNRLESLWKNENRQFTVRNIPDSAREQIIQLRVSHRRPYALTQRGVTEAATGREPHCPANLREYQQAAIRQWERDGCRGIFEMATGTGKTFTALAAAVARYRSLGKLALIVSVPYLHLLDQWADACRAFGFLPVLCSGSHSTWKVDARSSLKDLQLGISHVCILAVHDTTSTSAFARVAACAPPGLSMIIADEAHALGAPKLRSALLPAAEMRLGLTATPRRWYDDEGTQVLMDYFSGVSFEYSLEEAIGSHLVPYEYEPILVHLSDDEERTFADLTGRIASLQARADDDTEVAEACKRLLIERARILNGAENKLPAFVCRLQSMIADRREKGQELAYVLVYCAPGSHGEVLRAASRTGVRCHEFVHTVSMADRTRLLRQFANTDIQALIAVKCLDEGVDVPATQTAFFLASTTNPREFIQRRGRVLRRAENKHRALICDFIVVPSEDTPSEVADVLLRRELPRFAEFASAATNEFEARSVIRPLLDKRGMLSLLDERPWDVYRRLRAYLEA